MRYEVYRFEIERNSHRLGVFDKSFWAEVRAKDEDLPDACGCYVFALENRGKAVAWYVGKTEKRTFEQECFQATKIVHFNEVLVANRGTPFLFILPRLTASGKKFSKPTTIGYRDIDFLETMLIGMALEWNGKLVNAKKTKLLRNMVVPGVINTERARPTAAQTHIRKALGLVRN